MFSTLPQYSVPLSVRILSRGTSFFLKKGITLTFKISVDVIADLSV